MGTHDAKWTKELIERAQEAARPLKDKQLNDHLDAAKKHIVKRMDNTPPAKKA